MFLKPDTLKFIEERRHYLIQNAKEADELTESDFKKIAAHADISLKTVKDDAETYKFDLRYHDPQGGGL